MAKCLFQEEECVLEDMPTNAKWCRVCTDSRVGVELSMMGKMTVINGLLQIHHDEDKAREIYEKLKEFAEEW